MGTRCDTVRAKFISSFYYGGAVKSAPLFLRGIHVQGVSEESWGFADFSFKYAAEIQDIAVACGNGDT